jgi:hypothetical protein
MPAKPEWLLRLPDIRAELEHLDVPIVDRAGIERIFGLRRRRAIELMHEFGGYQTGRTFLLDRARLLEALHSLESREDYAAEKRRRERLRDVVEASREHMILTQVRIPMRAAAVRPSLDRLAPGVLLLPGILTIEFQRPIELLERLYWLAQAISHNFEQFEGLCPGGINGRRS